LETSYESDKDLHDRCLKLREHLLAMMPELFGSNITDKKVLIVSHSLLLTMWMSEGVTEGSILGSGCINSLFFNNT